MSTDQVWSGLSAFSRSRAGDISVGRTETIGSACRDWIAASDFGKNVARGLPIGRIVGRHRTKTSVSQGIGVRYVQWLWNVTADTEKARGAS